MTAPPPALMISASEDETVANPKKRKQDIPGETDTEIAEKTVIN